MSYCTCPLGGHWDGCPNKNSGVIAPNVTIVQPGTPTINGLDPVLIELTQIRELLELVAAALHTRRHR